MIDEILYGSRAVGDNIFTLIADFMRRLLALLDFPFYGQVSFLRLIIGFIALSAIITLFWKSAKG